MSPAGLAVEVVYALPRKAWSIALELPEGATVADALAAADLPGRVPGAVVDAESLAIFGRAVTPGTRLRGGDRVEVLRPLQVDPKQARRQRAGQSSRG